MSPRVIARGTWLRGPYRSAEGPITGQCLNALGTALGQAKLVYKFLTTRVMKEICPLGSFSDTTLTSIAAQAQASDNFSTIVVGIASDPSCY